MNFLCKITTVRLVWVIIPLVLFSIIGIAVLGQLSDQETAKEYTNNAMERMKSSRDAMMGTDDSMMNGMMDTKTNFPSSEPQQENSDLENEFDSYTSDWYITGYFLPIESDYSGKSMEISVDGVKQFYLEDFLDTVKIEGWGRTNAGNHLEAGIMVLLLYLIHILMLTEMIL